MPEVSIFVINHNGMDYFNRCLQSLLQTQTEVDFEIIVVDNKSTDGSLEPIERTYGSNPRVRVIPLDGNYGFAPGFMRAIELAKPKSNYLVFSDMDVYVEPNWLDEPLGIMRRDSRVAIVGPTVCHYGNRDAVQSCGGVLVNRYLLTMCAPRVMGMDYASYLEKYPEPYPVFMPCGAIFLWRADAFYDVGGFDMRSFLNGEEVDVSLKSWLAGYRVVIAPHSRVYHEVGYSRKRTPLPFRRRFSIFLSHRNLVRSVLKYVPRRDLLPAVIVNYLALFLQSVAEAVVLKDPILISQHLKSVVWNLENINDTLAEREKLQNKQMTLRNLQPVVESAMISQFMRGVRGAIGQAVLDDSRPTAVAGPSLSGKSSRR